MYRTLLRVLQDPLLAYRKQELKRMAWRAAGWMLIAEATLVMQPYPVKWFFDELQSGRNPNLLYGLCALMGISYILGTRLHTKNAAIRTYFFWRMWADLWGYAHWRELKLDTAWHVAHSTGEKESLIARNIAKVEALVDEALFNTVPVTIRIILTCFGVWFLGIHFGVIAAITLVLFGASLLRTERVMGPLRKEFRTQMKRAERDGAELNKTWRTLKQFGIEERECADHWMMLDVFCTRERERNGVFWKHYRLQEDVVSVSRALMYAAIVYWFNPGVGIGSVILATAWMERIYSNFYRFQGLQRSLNEGLEAARELCEIFSLVPEVRQPEHPRWPDSGLKGHYELRDVDFQFANRREGTLHGISLAIKPNECIALVGRRGSGKSTLASLLLREYDPNGGDILLDGMPLREMDLDRFRNETAVVTQRIDLFDDTVLGNIRRMHPSATFPDIIEAAKGADAHEFIARQEKGYDSAIGEDGIQLSGGQRQCIAIARALVRKPKILILDEATSSLDAESQAQVQKTIERLIRKRLATIVIIAHRLSTIQQADRIAVLDEGRIVEIGTHEELYASGGLYRYFVDRETARVRHDS
jgi:ABC-type multidrug transport system fused ATPase/permease subunit